MKVTMTPGQLMEVSWIIFFAFWVLASLSAKPIKTRGGGGLTRLLVAAAAFVLLFRAYDPRWGALRNRFLPDARWIVWTGAILTAAGIAFAIWARIHIGRYWSASVALKDSHKLIRTGPYARIRHPIYTGILLAIAGEVIALGTYVALLALAIITAGLWLKARKEENLLAGEFGPAFEEHRRNTGFFLPKLFGSR